MRAKEEIHMKQAFMMQSMKIFQDTSPQQPIATTEGEEINQT